jgi:hypothetical protein
MVNRSRTGDIVPKHRNERIIALAAEGFAMSGHAIHIKVDGRTYSGTYKVDRQVLTVTTNYGKKTAIVGQKVPHAALADQLLHELVRDEKGRKGSTL